MTTMRKNLPKTALPRLYYIDKQIASGRYPNGPQMAADYEISLATIYRDIDFMRNSLRAPIEYDTVKHGYYYTEKTYRLPAGFASSDELLTLGMTKTLLGLYKDTPLYDTAKALMDVITAPLADAKQPDWYENRIVVPHPASAPVDNALWETLVIALRENRVVTFDYQGARDSAPLPRRVHPWQLLFDNGAWVLSAWSLERRARRFYALVRIKNAALCDETFTLPKDYDYTAPSQGSYFGIYDTAASRRFRLVLRGEAVLLATDRQWAADQTVEPIAGGVALSFTSNQYGKVLEWLLTRGSRAYPVEPPELVTDWKTQVAEMAALSEAL
jgi:predicted DNA-binding transcriptional regulator YafY